MDLIFEDRLVHVPNEILDYICSYLTLASDISSARLV